MGMYRKPISVENQSGLYYRSPRGNIVLQCVFAKRQLSIAESAFLFSQFRDSQLINLNINAMSNSS